MIQLSQAFFFLALIFHAIRFTPAKLDMALAVQHLLRFLAEHVLADIEIEIPSLVSTYPDSCAACLLVTIVEQQLPFRASQFLAEGQQGGIDRHRLLANINKEERIPFSLASQLRDGD